MGRAGLSEPAVDRIGPRNLDRGTDLRPRTDGSESRPYLKTLPKVPTHVIGSSLGGSWVFSALNLTTTHPHDPAMLPDRKTLPHGLPTWVDEHDLWFVTICCERPCARPLTDTLISQGIRAGLAQSQCDGRLQLRLCTLMPDHLHLIAQWNHDRGMRHEVAQLKRWWARQLGIRWQRDFFDHRLRSAKEFEAKAKYVRMNPVRAGLVSRAEDWPHTWTG